MKLSSCNSRSFRIGRLGLTCIVIAGSVWAQGQSTSSTPSTGGGLYTVTDLGTLGGTYSQPYVITNNRLISGTASLSDGTQHAVIWFEGQNFDIGKKGLGGANSIAFGINHWAETVGEAETSIKDSEDFCGFQAMGLPSSSARCLPFVWQYDVMKPLPTLGGNNGVANSINNQGEVAGLAETNEKDPNCPAPQVFRFEAVLWEKGQARELPTVGGDPDGVAFAINDNGAVVGASGDCSAFSQNLLVNLQPLHALLWEGGTVTDLGNLGGTGRGNGIVGLNINRAGHVVGSSDLPGDARFHAFLWTKATGMRDLGTLQGDVSSVGLSINDKDEVVGLSLDSNFNPTAFVRRDGVMMDLNKLISGTSLLTLIQACSINSHGAIIGLAMDKSTGQFHGFLATPLGSKGSASGE
jgi:probable HAF family extracellular repeat protein